jgi:[ribosomal protein S18]-alanine N-acetyltransferase
MLVNVRLAIPEDLPHIIELERLLPKSAHWSGEQYRRAIQQPADLPERPVPLRVVLVAESRGSLHTKVNAPAQSPQQARRQGRGVLTAFLVARHADSEWELENIVVGSEFRHRGMGTQLIEALLARARETGGSAVFLEVRESNAAARRLYEKTGFREIGRRKFYYSDPPEDAILYTRST